MSSCSSWRETCTRCADVLLAEVLAAAAGLDEDARERDEAGEALGADRRLAPRASASSSVRPPRARSSPGATRGASSGPSVCRSCSSSTRSASSSASCGRAEDPRVLAEAEDERRELPGVGVGGREDDAVVGRLDVPKRPYWRSTCHAMRSDTQTSAVSRGVAELPAGAARVDARVEVGRALEVVLGLRRVGDLAADAVEAEDAHVVALVAAADEVELAVAEEQVVRVHLARVERVALQRVVVERDRLLAEDRRLDLRQALRQLVAAGRGGDVEAQAVGRVERAGPAPRDLLERQPQRLGVGELAVEQAERGVQRRQLGVGELDRREVEVLRPQRVGLLLAAGVDRLVDGELDAQRVELGAVRVEAPRERVLVHPAVALDVAPDLERRHRPPLRHQVRDQRELPDQLLGVLRHLTANDRGRHGRLRPCSGAIRNARRSLRHFSEGMLRAA